MWTVSEEWRCSTESVEIAVNNAVLYGDLNIPRGAKSVVLFAHGSGSSRHSPRNKLIANVLNQANIATLLFDLLTLEEEQIDLVNGQLRFDIALLAHRVEQVTKWVCENTETCEMDIGYFGASTGAAAALVAASNLPKTVGAVVSRGGRPDLAGSALRHVIAPTLLIVGERDGTVLRFNSQALELLPQGKQLVIIPGAAHLFEEPGALEEVSQLASDWFKKYLIKH